MSVRLLLLSYRGRIGRLWYWIGTLAVWGGTNALGFLMEKSLRTEATSFNYVRDGVPITETVAFPVMSDPVNILIWIASACLGLGIVYVSFAIQAKRWHDRNKSGWWSLIILVPVIGWVWTFVECGLLRGDEGTNRFGTDPLADPVAALDRTFGYEV